MWTRYSVTRGMRKIFWGCFNDDKRGYQRGRTHLNVVRRWFYGTSNKRKLYDTGNYLYLAEQDNKALNMESKAKNRRIAFYFEYLTAKKY